MDKLIEVLERPDEQHGLYKVKFEDKFGHTYDAYFFEEEYKLLLIKQKLFFEKNLDRKDIDEFEEAVRDVQRELDYDVICET